jgi:uncharacterized protein YndB with AHSA1/START domain
MEVPDRLERRIDVAASRDRVWAAFTEPAELLHWLPTHEAEVDLRIGDEAVIEHIAPPERLVFRWRPAGSDRPYTTVSIALRELPGDRTEVTLTESGFATLPTEIRGQAYEGNTKGWSEELEELRVHLEQERV